MPKGTSSRALASRSSRASPYPLNCGKDKELVHNSSDSEDVSLKADWEDAVCSICLNAPHNAVLLLCSSHDKGCRPYMCDTSYRHSNCLDQFRKACEASQMSDQSGEIFNYSQPANFTRLEGDIISRDGVAMEAGRSRHSRSGTSSSENESTVEGEQPDSGFPTYSSCENHEMAGLACPLCRGTIKGWTAVELARKYLNVKPRGCAHESCSFVGTYEELRKHARLEHPHARPSEIDPDQQRRWHRMEQQRDLGDVLSTIRSEIPGGMVFGDYVIEGENFENEGDEMGMDLPGDESNWLTVFFLFQVFEPTSAFRSGRNTSPRWRGLARGLRRLGSDSTTRQRRLWGENFEGNAGPDSNMPGSTDAGDHTGSSGSRRQRSWRR